MTRLTSKDHIFFKRRVNIMIFLNNQFVLHVLLLLFPDSVFVLRLPQSLFVVNGYVSSKAGSILIAKWVKRKRCFLNHVNLHVQ